MTYALPIYNIPGKHSCTVVIFNLSDTCWRSHTASVKMYLELQNILNVNFLTQKVLYPTQGNSILDLTLTDKKELITELKISHSLGITDNDLITFVMSKQN